MSEIEAERSERTYERAWSELIRGLQLMPVWTKEQVLGLMRLSWYRTVVYEEWLAVIEGKQAPGDLVLPDPHPEPFPPIGETEGRKTEIPGDIVKGFEDV